MVRFRLTEVSVSKRSDDARTSGGLPYLRRHHHPGPISAGHGLTAGLKERG
jgi:hypothetical protein